MTLVRSSWVMHLLAEDPAGPIGSGKPSNARAFERAAAMSPGSPRATLGNPGKRYRVLCGAVRAATAVHRTTITPEMVNCPKCRGLMEAKRATADAK